MTTRNIYIAGTARLNRFAKPPFSTELAKKGRCSSEEITSSDGITIVKWADNKSVAIALNCLGIG